MKQVKSYETKDGTLFTDRMEAEKHELMLNIRGFLQSNGRGTSLSATDVAKFLVNNSDPVYDLIGKYRRTIQGVKSQQKPTVTV